MDSMLQIAKKYWLGVAAAVLFGIAAVLIYLKLHTKELPENLVQGSGRIDGDLINMNAKYPGRIAKMDIYEGEAIQKGAVIAIIDSAEQKAQKAQIDAQIEALIQQLAAREIELSIAEKSLPESLVKAKANSSIKKSQQDELDAMINTQKSVVSQDQRDSERLNNLFSNRLIEKHQLEMVMLKLQGDKDQLSSLMDKREQLSKAIDISQSDQVEASAAQQKIAALREGIKASESGIKALKASQTQMNAVLSEMELRSPVDGFVMEKIANNGEVIGSGMAVATLIDPKSLYLKIFVDTLKNGKIKIGDPAVIFLDSDPDHAIAAKVARIEQKAEFTPKEVSVASDRIQRVFAVHLQPLNVDPLLKLGIPAVGVISLDGKGLPTSLHAVPE
ncbi:HlyD family secretion protein [Sulfuricurvum sp.]|uniref:HlyD family secretion protein n=1 Tax=Sulfuricurvum sp. TaxID=2025608 RepID=UPI002D504306|nr:HlyD family efflux transporter periplasmic adaptor subunit [Sulfuricurvum sp.]HZF70186.1 HlyD family efflux transporter periplasmic adaptor subunit [Sulfuricurvum sp.]